MTIYLDFDHTLFNTGLFFHHDLPLALSEFGITLELWQNTAKTISSEDYLLANHIEMMGHSIGKHIPLIGVERAISQSFPDLKPYLFKDVRPFLDEAKQHSAKLYLISYGAPTWQEYKVKATGIIDYFDDLIFSRSQQEKANLIQLNQMADSASGSMIMVDDSSFELDQSLLQNPSLKSYLLIRPELIERPEHRPDHWPLQKVAYLLDTIAHPKHQVIQSLNEVKLFNSKV